MTKRVPSPKRFQCAAPGFQDAIGSYLYLSYLTLAESLAGSGIGLHGVG